VSFEETELKDGGILCPFHS